MKRVLIIEDDADIAQLIALNLRDIECGAEIVTNGLDGVLFASQSNFDVIILDIMLPKLNGIDACRQIRAKKVQTPIIMLTSKSEEGDKLEALEIGADDYVTKPFSVKELMARVKARIRRFSPEKELSFIGAEKQLIRGPIRLDNDNHRAFLEGKPLNLTQKEFELLNLMMKNPGRAFSRSELLDLIWGDHFSGYEHTVNSHINRLRMKIEADSESPTLILTVWGIGYKFNENV
ncbi:MAG: response regulator transcription factor [Chloroherpetonaceae bacterium]|nr:response regulator transcription factor [Chloroherpetonaceae bacterium]